MTQASGKKIAYFSMEYAIDQSLKIYSGGLGFLSGSHIRSAFELKQNMIAIGILFKNGYYDQEQDENGYMKVNFRNRTYSFLQETKIEFTITIHNAAVRVKAFYLVPEIFNTVPLYLLSTDFPENDELARSISFHLYDPNQETKIAQSILLGAGGAKLLDHLGFDPDVYHLNEGHGLPLIFYLYDKYRNMNEVKKRLIFTSHTPEAAGNDLISVKLLKEMSFFGNLSQEEIGKIIKTEEDRLDFTQTALHTARIANGVSKIHKQVMDRMWQGKEICPLVSITNAQNATYWTDKILKEKLSEGNTEALIARKKELKEELIKEVADQTGKLFDPNILTIVWARRFAGYKRADLLIRDYQRFLALVNRHEKSIQVIWAGKPYPHDEGAIRLFNHLAELTKPIKRCAVLTGYELRLSAVLKKGADLWLNTPRCNREASGTSGITAAMNGALNFSIADGWFPEFARHGQNSFVINPGNCDNIEELDTGDSKKMLDILEREIIPTYYDEKGKWADMMKAAMTDILPAFDSARMAGEYYERMYV